MQCIDAKPVETFNALECFESVGTAFLFSLFYYVWMSEQWISQKLENNKFRLSKLVNVKDVIMPLNCPLEWNESFIYNE